MLNNVKGGFNMQSAQQIDCSGFKAKQGNEIQGTYTCTTSSNPKSGTGSGTGTSSGGASSTSKAAAHSFGVNEAVAGLSVVGGLLQMLL